MNTRSKILSPSLLKREIVSFRRKNRREQVVFTNGCFDILHAGHVQTLEHARSFGGALVVAINTDASVKRLKGPTRPIHSMKDRARVLAALEAVSWVTWFSAETPLKLIEILSPDVLIKGGDWPVAQIVGAEHVLSRGGKVLSLPILKGRSTTCAIEKAARASR